MNLAEFLLARIAEDEAAYQGAMHMGCDEDDSDGPGVIHSATCPNRVLAECDAKRRIVDLHELVTVDYTGQWWTDRNQPAGTYVKTGCDTCTSCGVDGEAYIDNGPCMTLRLLALPYADHPDYRSEWAP